nr:PREDICTED: putative gustatory receptor 28a [Tribolium castaneum]|eukprot:XP_015839420.1 PREDICTED: putative gustatory receptor 28a [Tribolium castaneum]
MFLLVILEYLIGNIVSIFSSQFNDISGAFVLLYPRMIGCNLSVTYFGTTLLLEERFKLVNKFLLGECFKSRNCTKYPTDPNFCDKIKLSVNIHKELTRICRAINSIFSVFFLLWVTVNFLCLVSDLYIVAYLISSGQFFNYWQGELKAFKNVCIYSIEMFYIARRSSRLCSQANRTKTILVGLKVDLSKEEERNTIITSSLELRQFTLQITACRLFTIDNALLFSICGAAFSYLFIMIQMDKDLNKSLRNVTNSIL